MATSYLMPACLASQAAAGVATQLPPQLPPPPHGGAVPLIDGGDATKMQFPWQAALLTPAGRFFCGGSIIDAEWVLTAGHCVDQLLEFKVVVGTLDLDMTVEQPSRRVYSTSQRHQHPRFDMVFLDNDIGLLKLPDKIHFNIVVRAVALPSYGMAAENLVGQTAYTSGWGKTSDESTGASPALKYTTLTILPNEECENLYGNTMLGNKLCLSAEDGHSVCQGDSGGALVVPRGGKNVQIGITSFVSYEGCMVRLPQGFTRVTSFLGFIEETTGITIRD